MVGIRVLSHPQLQLLFGLVDQGQLQTVMFLQLVTGGRLLIFVTRTDRWFFLPPFPAPALFGAVVFTQVVAVLLCGLGWLVEPIAWPLIGWILVYCLAWMLVLGGVRQIAERVVQRRTARGIRALALVNRPLQGQLQPAGHGSATQ